METTTNQTILCPICGGVVNSGLPVYQGMWCKCNPTPIIEEIKAVPYQLCPKCNGQGIVSKPAHIAGDVIEWVDSQGTHQCNLCNGKMIIPMFTNL